VGAKNWEGVTLPRNLPIEQTPLLQPASLFIRVHRLIHPFLQKIKLIFGLILGQVTKFFGEL
jgi:hypothetical protein